MTPEYHFETFRWRGLFNAATRDGRSLRQIALDAGITPKYFYQLMSPEADGKYIRPYTVDKLARALDIDRKELIV